MISESGDRQPSIPDKTRPPVMVERSKSRVSSPGNLRLRPSQERLERKYPF